MANERIVRGSCLCGAVRLAFRLPSKWCAHCHCSRCRRQHGAGYVTWAGFDSDRFSVLAGREQLRWFPSSPGAERGFCANCGSSLLFRSERWPGEIHVALGCLDDPLDRAPQAHAFADTMVEWMGIDHGLPFVNPDA